MKINPKKFLKPKYIIIFVIIIAVAVAGSRVINNKFFSKKSTSTMRTTIVKKGDLTSVVTGSAAIESASKATILSKVNSTVKKVYFKAGDKVKKGDLLYEFDSKDAEINVERNNLSLQQTKMSVQSAADDTSNLNITAPYDGMITDLKVKAGSKIGNNDILFTITDNSKLKLTVPFNAADAGKLSIGMNVSVNIEDVMQTISGRIINIGAAYSGNSGIKQCDISIEINNPGAVKEGMKASAEVNSSGKDIQSISNGSFTYENKESMSAGTSGTIESVNASENKAVKKGDLIVKIKNSEVAQNEQSAELKLNDASLQLQSAQNSLLDYKIYSTASGTLVEQEINEGDSVKEQQELAVIADTSKMEFAISVDELDIAKIKVGQDVSITVDALTDTTKNPLSGKVSNIAEIGTSSNGVTTYPVTITIDKAASLKEGMNANASISIYSKKDVLLLPVEALHKINGKNYVMVKTDAKTAESAKKNSNINLNQSESSSAESTKGTTNKSSNTNKSTRTRNSSGSSGNIIGNLTKSNQSKKSSSGTSKSTSLNSSYYDSSVPTEVEIGLNNETYVEIVSGVKENDVVLLPPLTTGTSTSTAQNTGMSLGGGMTSGGGGEPPSGGGPQGSSGGSSKK